MNHNKFRGMVQGLFGADVGVGVTDPRHEGYALLPPEPEAIKRAIPKRRREFAAGRAAARAALADIGADPVAIPAAADRSPVWPAGIAGSISHCDRLCVAVACRLKTARAIGVDIEGKTPIEKEAWPIILTPAEHTVLEALPRWLRAKYLKTIFSIKEAVYKAQYPLTGQVCDFQAMDVTLGKGQFQARFAQQLGSFQPGFIAQGRYHQSENWVMSGCMLPNR